MKKLALWISLAALLSPISASAEEEITRVFNAEISTVRAYEMENAENPVGVYIAVNGQYAIGENPAHPGVSCALWTYNDRLAELATQAQMSNRPVNIAYTGGVPHGAMEEGSVCRAYYLEIAD